LIEHEIKHLKNRTSVRYGTRERARSSSLWLLGLAICALVGLYLLDPLQHAVYKYQAIHAYGYLHAFGGGREAAELASSGILRPEEVTYLNQGLETYKDSYATPAAAAQTARSIVNYMAEVKLLHAGRWEKLDLLERVRYDLFVRPGLPMPIAWSFLDPDAGA
jgi:hypothetical protein